MIPPDNTKCPTHGDLRSTHCGDCSRLTREEMTRIAQEAVGAAHTDELAARASRLGQYVHDVEDRFDCGHRKLDWDDSYGKCVLCPLIAQAHENDDKDGRIEELRREHGTLWDQIELLRAATDKYPLVLPGSPRIIDEALAQMAWMEEIAITDDALMRAATRAAEAIGKRVAHTMAQAFGQPVELKTKGLEELIVEHVKRGRGHLPKDAKYRHLTGGG